MWPGLVSSVFNLDSFFTFTCFGKSPERHQADVSMFNHPFVPADRMNMIHHRHHLTVISWSFSHCLCLELFCILLLYFVYFKVHQTDIYSMWHHYMLDIQYLSQTLIYIKYIYRKRNKQREEETIKKQRNKKKRRQISRKLVRRRKRGERKEEEKKKDKDQNHLLVLLPAILISPSRTTWGQFWKVLMKNGLVTPRTTLGLKRTDRWVQVSLTHRAWVLVVYPLNLLSDRWVRQTGEFRCVWYSRGLGPGGVLSELVVMDGEIWTEVTAKLQRTDGAERGHTVTTATTQPLLPDWLL